MKLTDTIQLIENMAAVMSGPGAAVPGFISAALHRSLDGTKVVVYSQWSSKEAGEALKGMVELRPYIMKAMELASMTPMVYEVADTFIGVDYKP